MKCIIEHFREAGFFVIGRNNKRSVERGCFEDRGIWSRTRWWRRFDEICESLGIASREEEAIVERGVTNRRGKNDVNKDKAEDGNEKRDKENTG
jgi:hypothetical protein